MQQAEHHIGFVAGAYLNAGSTQAAVDRNIGYAVPTHIKPFQRMLCYNSVGAFKASHAGAGNNDCIFELRQKCTHKFRFTFRFIKGFTDNSTAFKDSGSIGAVYVCIINFKFKRRIQR